MAENGLPPQLRVSEAELIRARRIVSHGLAGVEQLPFQAMFGFELSSSQDAAGMRTASLVAIDESGKVADYVEVSPLRNGSVNGTFQLGEVVLRGSYIRPPRTQLTAEDVTWAVPAPGARGNGRLAANEEVVALLKPKEG